MTKKKTQSLHAKNISRLQAQQRRYEKQRYDRLINEGFLPRQAKLYTDRAITTPEMRRIRRYQAGIQRKAEKEGLTGKRYYDYIRTGYKRKGWTDIQGNIKAQDWQNFVFEEIEKPRRERSLFIDIKPDAYSGYKMLVDLGMTEQQATDRSSNISYRKIVDRVNSPHFQALIRHRLTRRQALEAVLSLSTDNKLQRLPPLNDRQWQAFLNNHVKEYERVRQQALKKGYSKDQARKYAHKALEKNFNPNLDIFWQDFRAKYPKKRKGK